MEGITTEQLNEILTKHAEWVNSCGAKGVRANLWNADLSGADLRGADLRGACLWNANLWGANLGGANLGGADLRDANLWNADLRGANLSCADLNDADLSSAFLGGANLWNANLWCADLRYADLRDANLKYAILEGANLGGANLAYAELEDADLAYANLRNANLRNANLKGADLSCVKNIFFPMACPEKGSFIAFKKAGCYIIELFIPSNANRCSATSRKCRCSKAKVISITTLSGNKTNITEVHSTYDPNFIYKLGEYVEVKNFDNNRWNECSTGIHFFITRQEAVNY